jgi:hypothetical protein
MVSPQLGSIDPDQNSSSIAVRYVVGGERKKPRFDNRPRPAPMVFRMESCAQRRKTMLTTTKVGSRIAEDHSMYPKNDGILTPPRRAIA